MIDLKEAQKKILENKIEKGFNTTNIHQEFSLLHGEVSEAYEAWWKKKDDLGEELADATIYLLGLAEILGFNLEDELRKKIKKNKERKFIEVNGVKVKVEKEK